MVGDKIMTVKRKTIGILAMQGAVAEHQQRIQALPNTKVVLVKTKEDLNSIDGLILPGGESTAMRKLLDYFNLINPLKEKIKQGLPVWGTCAGMILLAKQVENDIEKDNNIEKSGLDTIGTMDISVYRNAYGSQLNSFYTEKIIPKIDNKKPLPLVFIRAPYITKAADCVEVLAKIDNHIVAAKEKNMLATSFHPELTDDLSFHKYFLSIV